MLRCMDSYDQKVYFRLGVIPTIAKKFCYRFTIKCNFEFYGEKNFSKTAIENKFCKKA